MTGELPSGRGGGKTSRRGHWPPSRQRIPQRGSRYTTSRAKLPRIAIAVILDRSLRDVCRHQRPPLAGEAFAVGTNKSASASISRAFKDDLLIVRTHTIA
jgi:hypothetical protein